MHRAVVGDSKDTHSLLPGNGGGGGEGSRGRGGWEEEGGRGGGEGRGERGRGYLGYHKPCVVGWAPATDHQIISGLTNIMTSQPQASPKFTNE